jgi:hypothetical protein
MRDTIHWVRLLAFVTGLVNQELLLQNECLVAENRILRARLPSRLKLSDPERRSLIQRLGAVGASQLFQQRLTHRECVLASMAIRVAGIFLNQLHFRRAGSQAIFNDLAVTA